MARDGPLARVIILVEGAPERGLIRIDLAPIILFYRIILFVFSLSVR